MLKSHCEAQYAPGIPDCCAHADRKNQPLILTKLPLIPYRWYFTIEAIMVINMKNRLASVRRNLTSVHPVRGFTLIELMITIAILAILLTIAVPNFITFVQNSRLTGQANDFVTALNYARSEAIKRGVRVTVCSRSTDTACAGSTTWDTGWLVFVDPNNDGVIDVGETVLLVRQPLENGNTLRAAQRQRVTYQNSGFSGNADTFRLCDTRGTASGRAMAVNFQGRVSTTTGTASCP